jgi:hypothetical protein
MTKRIVLAQVCERLVQISEALGLALGLAVLL